MILHLITISMLNRGVVISPVLWYPSGGTAILNKVGGNVLKLILRTNGKIGVPTLVLTLIYICDFVASPSVPLECYNDGSLE